MPRSPKDVFNDHGKALLSEDLDGIVANFAEDAIMITPKGAKRGREGVREAFSDLFTDLPAAKWDLRKVIFEGDVLFLEWEARSGTDRAEHGVDTFIFSNGFIQAQTVRYTLTAGN